MQKKEKKTVIRSTDEDDQDSVDSKTTQVKIVIDECMETNKDVDSSSTPGLPFHKEDSKQRVQVHGRVRLGQWVSLECAVLTRDQVLNNICDIYSRISD